jgi:hypothetical protein
MIHLHDIQTANTVVYVVTLIFSYGMVVTLAGSFRAYIAYRFGDPTAAELGFLPLDPIRHIDILGFLCYLWFRFGWGKYIPVDVHNIHGKHAKFKRVFAFFADSIAYILLAIGLVLVFLIIFGFPLLDYALSIMRQYGGVPSQYAFTQINPHASSIHLTCVFVYLLFTYVSVVFGAISFVINFFHYALMKLTERISLHEMSFGMLFGKIIALYILFTIMIRPVHYGVLAIIHYASYFFAYCLGVLT